MLKTVSEKRHHSLFCTFIICTRTVSNNYAFAFIALSRLAFTKRMRLQVSKLLIHMQLEDRAGMHQVLINSTCLKALHMLNYTVG